MNNIELYERIAKKQEISPRFKIEILAQDETVIGEIVNDIIDGNISINYNQGVYRSCNVTLADPFGKYIPSSKSIFWIGRKFKIYTGLEYTKYYLEDNPLIYSDNVEDLIYVNKSDVLIERGKSIRETLDILWFSQGVFYVNSPSSNRDFSNTTTTITGVDKFGIFGSELGYNQLEGTYLIPQKTKASNAIKDILMLEMGNGYVIDSISPILPQKLNEELPFDIKKAPSSYLSDILKDIANIFGCNIFYDENGRLNITEGTLDPSYSEEASIWEFTDVLPEYMKSSMSFDFIGVVNTIKAVGTNINDKIYEYTAENRNVLSDTNIDLIGRKMKYIENPNIYDNDRAKDFAIYTLNKESIVPISINFECSLLPHLTVNKVITISDKYYGYNQQRFIIQSITMPLTASKTMSITATNLASLPYWELQSGGE